MLKALKTLDNDRLHAFAATKI